MTFFYQNDLKIQNNKHGQTMHTFVKLLTNKYT